MNHQGSTFTCGATYRDILFFAKSSDDLVEKGKPNSAFLFMEGDDWVKYDEIVNWTAISMARIGRAKDLYAVAIGFDGQFWEIENGSLAETLGQISAEDISPRSLAVVEETIYAVGMGRIVLRRERLNLWTPIGPAPATAAEGVIGFEDMAGYATDEMYAVGWQGEIWWRDNATWRQVDSPVSANLNAVYCGDDGVVYAVGDNGTMLRGRHETWAVVETGRDENLMDVCYFDNTVYVATDFRILKLTADGLEGEDRFVDPGDVPANCLLLLRAPDSVFSMGPTDLFRLSPGGWQRLV